VTRAAAMRARDPRVDPARIGALGFGIGARAVALAPPAEDGRALRRARPALPRLREPRRAAPGAEGGVGAARVADPDPARRGRPGERAGGVRGARRRAGTGAGTAGRLPGCDLRVGPPANGGKPPNRAALAAPRRHGPGAGLAGAGGVHGGAGGGVPRPGAARAHAAARLTEPRQQARYSSLGDLTWRKAARSAKSYQHRGRQAHRRGLGRGAASRCARAGLAPR
jgi:hypothetical protein